MSLADRIAEWHLSGKEVNGLTIHEFIKGELEALKEDIYEEISYGYSDNQDFAYDTNVMNEEIKKTLEAALKERIEG